MEAKRVPVLREEQEPEDEAVLVQEEQPVSEHLDPLIFACGGGMAGVSTLVTLIVFLLDPHTSGGIWFLDFILTVLSGGFGPLIIREVYPRLPMPSPREQEEGTTMPRLPGGRRSLADRLAGRFPDGPAPVESGAVDEIDDDVESLSDEEAEEAIDEAMEDYEFRNAIPQPTPVARPSSSGYRMPIVVRAADPRREVLLAENLGLDIQEVAESGVFIVGMKGSGKSTVAARLMEQVGRWPLIQVIYDIKGDFVSLVEEKKFLNGLIVTKDTAFYVDDLWRNHRQIVIDLRTWTSMEARTRVIAAYNKALLQYAMALPEHLRQFYFVHLDEGQQFVAQGCPDDVSKEAWHAAKSSYANLGAIGRASGAVPCLYTQRIADIHKDVIAHQEILVFMKAALNNDLDRYHEYVGEQTASDAQIRAFRPGEGIVVLPDGKQFVTRFLNRESRHGSHSPQFEQVLSLYQAAQGGRREQVLPGASQALPTLQEEAPVSPSKDVVLTERQAQALKLILKGEKGPRALERAMNIPYYQAQKICKELKEMGLIEDNDND